MGVIINKVTHYKPKYPAIDVHCHIFERSDVFLRGVRKVAEQHPELNWTVFAKNCFVSEARNAMRQAGIRVAFGKNLAAKPSSVPAANTFAILVEREEQEKNFNNRLMPAGSLHLNYKDNLQEIDRLFVAGVRVITFDSCVQGFMVDDPGMKEIYRAMAQANMIAHFHTGPDSGSKHQDVLTFPPQIKKVKDMAPDLLIVADHLGSGGDYSKIIEYKGTDGIFFGTAWAPEEVYFTKRSSKDEILEIIFNILGPEWIVYGSDFGWGDPGRQIAFWEELLPDEAWQKISHQNAVEKLGIQLPPAA